MIELARHIAFLLLENDCVIVPGLGGFVAHYTPATRMPEEHLFLPPSRVVGFNSRLKINDGLLVQSYMEVYGTGFADAAKMVEKATRQLLAALHEEGKADLPDIGELHCTIENTLDFTPYDNKLATPYLYGLDSFEMKELVQVERKAPVQTGKQVPVKRETDEERKTARTIPMVPHRPERRTPRVHIKRTYLTHAAILVAAIALFFFLSTPIANTDISEGTRHALLTSGLLPGGLDSRSLLVTPIPLQKGKAGVQQDKTTQNGKTASKSVTPKVVKEVKVSTQPVVVQKPAATADAAKSTSRTTDNGSSGIAVKQTVIPGGTSPAAASTVTEAAASTVTEATAYHIIVASLGKEEDARAMAAQLVTQGYKDAKAIIGDGKMRVCLESFTTQSQAYTELAKVRQNEAFENAWVLKK